MDATSTNSLTPGQKKRRIKSLRRSLQKCRLTIQELEQAEIKINLQANEKGIAFSIKNSIPNVPQESESETEGIGLQNIRRQLQLLYPQRHRLEIFKKKGFFIVELRIVLV